MKIGDPVLVPMDDIETPEDPLAITELSGIVLYAVETKAVPGLADMLEDKHQSHAVLVYYPDEEFVHTYLYPTEEDVLEDIWDIEYRIANFIYS